MKHPLSFLTLAPLAIAQATPIFPPSGPARRLPLGPPRQSNFLALSAALVAFLIASAAMTAQTQAAILANPPRPDLGDAANFALFSATVITTGGIDLTNSFYEKVGTKNTWLNGALWTANFTTTGIDYTGAGPTDYTGSDIHYGDTLAASAYSAASAAYTSSKELVIAGLTTATIGTALIDGELMGKTFTHGMYTVGAGGLATDAAFTVLGDFTLDGGGNPDSVFIFASSAKCVGGFQVRD
jgi:hypothetical protein